MEIKGIWKNNTTESIAVTVNGEQYSGIIEASGLSPIMTMSLSSLMILRVNITNSAQLSSPVLLWQNDDFANPSILQQAVRFGSWEDVSVDRSIPWDVYRFIVEEIDGGLLIVGTVELVEGGILAQASR